MRKKLGAKQLQDEEQAQRAIALRDPGIEAQERLDSRWPERTAARSDAIAQLRRGLEPAKPLLDGPSKQG